MATDHSPTWERVSLYYQVEAAWGTAKTGAGFHRMRESSRCWPYAAKPLIELPGTAGNGRPFPDAGDLVQGQEALSFSSTHPATRDVLRDFMCLLFQDQHYLDVADFTLSPCAADDSVVWTPDIHEKQATVVVKNDAAAGASSYFVGTSCSIRSLALTIPQNTPGESGGLGEITLDWIGMKGERASSHSITSPTDDTSARLLTSGWTLEIDGVARKMCAANITINNGAFLDMQSGSGDNVDGILYGPFSANGSVTVLLDEDSGGSAQDDLLDSWDGNTLVTLEFINILAENDFNIHIPTVIRERPTESDINGIQALSFNFELRGDANDDIKVKVEDLDNSEFYTA